MKEKNQTKKEQLQNPYEKLFDDANRRIKKPGDMEFLDEIIEDEPDSPVKIPFPYGNNRVYPYNFNSN